MFLINGIAESLGRYWCSVLVANIVMYPLVQHGTDPKLGFLALLSSKQSTEADIGCRPPNYKTPPGLWR